jgi:hypothetical protein
VRPGEPGPKQGPSCKLTLLTTIRMRCAWQLSWIGVEPLLLLRRQLRQHKLPPSEGCVGSTFNAAHLGRISIFNALRLRALQDCHSIDCQGQIGQ